MGAPEPVPAGDVLPPNRVLFAWQEMIRDDVELTTLAKATAWALGTRMDLYGRGAHPSLTTLARDVSRGRRTVMKHLNVLEDRGYIIRQRPKRPGPTHFTSYVAAVPHGALRDPTEDREPGDPSAPVDPSNREPADPSSDEIGNVGAPDREPGDPLAPPVAPPLENPLSRSANKGAQENADDEDEGEQDAHLVTCPACGTSVALGPSCSWCGEEFDLGQRLALAMPGAQIVHHPAEVAS